ncbi:unnamed protein product, partial [Musa acuminata subsp. burmannicoides]
RKESLRSLPRRFHAATKGGVCRRPSYRGSRPRVPPPWVGTCSLLSMGYIDGCFSKRNSK